MKGYQLRIKGVNNLTYEVHRMYSKIIYLHEPTEIEIEAFVTKCLAKDDCFDFGIVSQEPYGVEALEVEVMD